MLASGWCWYVVVAKVVANGWNSKKNTCGRMLEMLVDGG